MLRIEQLQHILALHLPNTAPLYPKRFMPSTPKKARQKIRSTITAKSAKHYMSFFDSSVQKKAAYSSIC
jgi:hypothetical protein